MKNALILMLALLCGCASSRQIVDLKGMLPPEDRQFETVDDMLRYHLTDEAYALVADIPMIDGPSFSPYAAGTTFLSNLATLVSFNGVGRKVILPSGVLLAWGSEAVLHEYVHHIDEMGRSGDIEPLIDIEEFADAFYMLERDSKYAWLAINTNRRIAAQPFFYDAIISIGPHSEQIAYTVGQIARTGKCPEYLKLVLRRVLRFRAAEEDGRT